MSFFRTLAVHFVSDCRFFVCLFVFLSVMRLCKLWSSGMNIADFLYFYCNSQALLLPDYILKRTAEYWCSACSCPVPQQRCSFRPQLSAFCGRQDAAAAKQAIAGSCGDRTMGVRQRSVTARASGNDAPLRGAFGHPYDRPDNYNRTG